MVTRAFTCAPIRIVVIAVALSFAIVLIIDIPITFASNTSKFADVAPFIVVISTRAFRSSGPHIPIFEVRPGHLEVEHGHVLGQGGKGLKYFQN
jgi:hypothetical protein